MLKIGAKGRIISGNYSPNGELLIEDDTNGTGGFYIYIWPNDGTKWTGTNDDMLYDTWLETWEGVESEFRDNGWEIEWYEGNDTNETDVFEEDDLAKEKRLESIKMMERMNKAFKLMSNEDEVRKSLAELDLDLGKMKILDEILGDKDRAERDGLMKLLIKKCLIKEPEFAKKAIYLLVNGLVEGKSLDSIQADLENISERSTKLSDTITNQDSKLQE